MKVDQMLLNLRKISILKKADNEEINSPEFSPMNIIQRVLEGVPNDQYIKGDVNAPGAESQALKEERGVLAEMIQGAVTQSLESRDILPGTSYKLKEGDQEDDSTYHMTDESYKDFISEFITTLMSSSSTPLYKYTDPSFEATRVPTEEDFTNSFNNYIDMIVPYAWKNYVTKALKESEDLISLDEPIETDEGSIEPLVSRIEDPKALQEFETPEQDPAVALLQQVKNSLTNDVQRELLDMWMYDTPDYPIDSGEFRREKDPPTALQKPATDPAHAYADIDVLEDKAIQTHRLWNERHPENVLESPQVIIAFIQNTVGPLINDIRQHEGKQPYGAPSSIEETILPEHEESLSTPQEDVVEDNETTSAKSLGLKSSKKGKLNLRKCEHSLCLI